MKLLQIITKQGTSYFIMYVNIRKLTYILSRRTVLYPLRMVVRKSSHHDLKKVILLLDCPIQKTHKNTATAVLVSRAVVNNIQSNIQKRHLTKPYRNKTSLLQKSNITQMIAFAKRFAQLLHENAMDFW